jgi:hypothetical protein
MQLCYTLHRWSTLVNSSPGALLLLTPCTIIIIIR